MTDRSAAIEELSSLVKEGFKPQSLDQLYDWFKLLGVVFGYITLLDAAVNGSDKERVPAARTLVNLKEDPESIAERLKRSPFANLSIHQLEAIIQRMKSGETDMDKIIEEVKKELPNGRI
jgi:hypothetical protein